jgi:lipopolysaccharide export system permease protein
LRILSRYIRDSFLVTFGLTLVVFTFVMCIMVLFRISDYLAMGGSGHLILRIFLAGMPSALGFSIPVSILTSALLTFGKLSANGEITAMKSSGVRMWQIIRQPVLFAVLLAAICLHLNAEIIPISYHVRRLALRDLGAETPTQLLEEGRFIRDFPGFTFYFSDRKGDWLHDIIIYQHQAGHVPRNIRAKRGTAHATPDKTKLIVDLYDVRIDPFDESRPGAGTCGYFPLEIDLGRLSGDNQPARRKSDLIFGELLEQVRNPREFYPELDPQDLTRQQMTLTVELHKRIVLSLSCFTFVLLGIPLATKTHRRESSIGIGISLGLVFFFYLFIIVAESLAKHPALHPQLIMWTPVVLAVGLGLALIHRND